MPIYEYRCTDCTHEFERMQRFSDPPVTACPSCAGTVQKLISRSAFHLKGSGWYVTDYARNGSHNGKSSEGKTSDGSDTKTSSESSTASSESSTGSSESSTGSSESSAASSGKASKAATAAA